MAKMVLLASFLSINGVDLSDHTTKAEVVVEVEDKDVTTFASGGWKEVLGGLKSGSCSAGFLQNPAAGAIDATMWPLLGQVVPFEVRLDNAPVGPANPAYTGNLLVKKWAPIAGSVGDVSAVEVDFPTSGAVTRATA